MIDLETWLLFVVTETALCISPGPAVLYVSSHGLSGGFRSSVSANLGIVTGNIVYFSMSALGIGAVILASHDLFLVIKWFGMAYLVFLGLRMILGASSLSAVPASGRIPKRDIYRGGIVVQLTNSKNLVFFLAILPPFIDQTKNLYLQMLVLGVTSQIIEILTLLSYGAAAGELGTLIRESRLAAWVDRVAGSLLVAIGVGMAFIRRAEA